LRLLANVKIERGNLTTPLGTPYIGFKVTIGAVTDPRTIARTYEDIEAILKSNKVSYRETLERRPDGKFKSYKVESGQF